MNCLISKPQNFITSFCLLISILFIQSGCSRHTKDEIKMGMTQTEVENLINKPASILSGSPAFVNDYSDTIKYLKSGDTLLDHNRWLIPKRIKRSGSNIFWVYPEERKDTFYVLLKNYHYVSVKETTKTKNYYIFDMAVSEAYYKSSETPAQFKTIKVVSSIKSSNNVIKDPPVKSYMIVYNKYCVVFDSSTGRVTNKGYFPCYMSGQFSVKD
jgi:hypothetical protein